MRKISSFLLFIIASSLNAQVNNKVLPITLSQSDFTVVERNSDGTIKSVRYAATDDNIPANANEFFRTTLKKRDADDFELDRSQKSDYGMTYERYQQYYQGVIVDGGYYNFRFKNGRMKVAKGHYVNVSGINPVPSIKKNEAINLYAHYFGILISDTIKSCVNLMIKEIPIADKKESVVALTYKVFLLTSEIEGSYIGYVDAHTGELLYKEDAYVNYSTTGQFYTYYNSNTNPKYGITDYSNGMYHLIDYSRGLGILTGTNCNGSLNYFPDSDNIWTQAEMGSFNMALDVHWTMEKIWETMISIFHYNSYDGNGRRVCSIIETNVIAHYYNALDIFYFGYAPGSLVQGPPASVDIIGHEYGHAILYNATHLNNGPTGDLRNAIHEGLADIWGIILEKHISPNADYWKSGEQIMINGESCMRNFQNPNDTTAHTQISSTYGCGLYYSSDPEVKGGFLPYWFYLLVNGGSGTNGYNNSYQLIPVGFDLAEELFAKATLYVGYLEGSTTFEEVRQGLLDAALDMNNSFLVEQVKNSFYAVGLYSEPEHIYLQSCGASSATYYVYGNSNCSVNWSFTKTSGATPSLVPNSSNHSCTLSSTSSFSGNLYATINCGGCTATYSKYISFAGSPSSVGGDVMQVVPIDETHYQLSLDGEKESGYIKVYDASSLQVKTKEKLMDKNYVLDTSSWKRGLYIIEVTVGNKSYTTKLAKK